MPSQSPYTWTYSPTPPPFSLAHTQAPLALACMASPGHAGDVRLGVAWWAGLVDGRVTDLWSPGRPVELHVCPARTHRAAAWVRQCGDRVRQFGDRVRRRVAVSGSSGFRMKGGWRPQPSFRAKGLWRTWGVKVDGRLTSHISSLKLTHACSLPHD